jgi:diguanylate cyclase (GGDEF)-like protein
VSGQGHDVPRLGAIQVERQRVILRRLRMGMLAWAISIFITGTAWALGLLESGYLEMGALLLVVLASQLFFHVAIRSGWSMRLRDPSLTLVHILLAVGVGLWVISRAGEGRTILLILFILAAFFGAFQLRQREFMFIALVAVAGYTGIVVRDVVTQRMDRSTEVVVLELAGFATVMLWLAWFGSYIARLRRELSRRNRELHEATQRLQHLAEHDELTGLPNRRHLLSRLEQAAERASQGDAEFSIAVLDLDHFKRVNDTHGHQAGDEVLAEFSHRAAALLRGADALMRVDETIADIGRFGGEEFLAILPDTDLAGARLAAERLRSAVAERPFPTNDGPIDCTVSIGVTQYRPGEALHRTIARADRALYAAKSGGRNRVEVTE